VAEAPDKPGADQGMEDLAERFSPGELSAREGQPESYGPNPTLIPKKYQEIFRGLCRKVAMRDQFARIEEVKHSATGRFYWRGMFDVCWNEQNSIWEQPGLNAALGPLNHSQEDTGDISLSYPLNIYQSYGRGHITVVSEPWKIRMEAKKIDSPDALRIAGAADTMREKIEAQNDIKKLRVDASRLSWTDGRVSFYSRWVTDGARFGYEDESHDEETAEGIGEGGDPPKKKPRQPKGGELVEPFGVLECKVPINMRTSNQFMWRQLSIEIDMTSAKSMYPWVAKRMTGGEPGPGEYNFDRTTRIACTQGIKLLTQSGDTVEQLPTWQRTWFRPSFFAEIESDEDRIWMEENYPDGALVEFIGDAYCCSRNESMDDHWVDVHPLPGDGQSTPACGALIMPAQDALLDLTDLKMERAMKSIPAIWCNKNAGINLQAISKQKAGPGAHYPLELTDAQTAENQFFVEPAPEAPADESLMFDALLTSIPQQLTGLSAAALGESDPSNQTAKGLQLLQAASKGQSGIAWSAFREGYARSMMQLVRVGAYFRASEMDEDGTITLDDTTIDLEDLRDGNWACVPDGDESYPNTHAEQREALMEALQIESSSPFGQLIADDPENLSYAKDLIGLQKLKMKGASTTEKEMGIIKQMLKEPPIPGPAFMQYKMDTMAAQLQGQPAPPKPPDEQLFEPSIPIDPEVDDASLAYPILRNWLNSSEGVQAMRNSPDGYKNIRLRMLAFKKAQQADQDAAQQKATQLMLAQEAAKHPPKSPKDPSENLSIAYKDLGPSGQIQAAAKMGIDVTPDVGADLAREHMAAGTRPAPAQTSGQTPPPAVQ
jgi:hypothetical protein